MSEQNQVKRVMVVTGSRADFGLLEPVMKAIEAQKGLKLLCVVAGLHFVMGSEMDVVRAGLVTRAEVKMQKKGRSGYDADVQAFAKGVSGFGKVMKKLRADVVLVLGDRIEAFAAASAASIGGVCLAHIHGGDRAEGVADEAMRHAISKMAQLHFPATRESAKRLEKMGEDKKNIFCVGSPAMDGLEEIEPMEDEELEVLGIDHERDFVVVMQHGAGGSDDEEYENMRKTLEGVCGFEFEGREVQVVVMGGNLDVGSGGVGAAVNTFKKAGKVVTISHVNRGHYVGLLKRAAALVGNSSGGLIEAAGIGEAGMAVVNVGPRQNGREKPMHVVDCGYGDVAVADALKESLAKQGRRRNNEHGYGDGDAGEKIARMLRKVDLGAVGLRKCNGY